MNNKLLRQNAIMIWFITNFIESIDNDIKSIKDSCKYDTSKYDTKYIDIKMFNEIKRYFEGCLKEVYRNG